MVRSIRNQKGFSLVELMVVVAIIGILSAIAIPQINKYMARARQTEAKTNLSAIYTSNKAFFAEYNIYDSRFDVIGYRPEGKLRYNVGWAAAMTDNLESYGYTGGYGSNATNAVAQCGVLNSTGSGASAGGSVVGPAGCIVLADGNKTLNDTSLERTTTSNTFRAGAISRISSGQVADEWTIDQVKELRNTKDGTQ